MLTSLAPQPPRTASTEASSSPRHTQPPARPAATTNQLRDRLTARLIGRPQFASPSVAAVLGGFRHVLPPNLRDRPVAFINQLFCVHVARSVMPTLRQNRFDDELLLVRHAGPKACADIFGADELLVMLSHWDALLDAVDESNRANANAAKISFPPRVEAVSERRRQRFIRSLLRALEEYLAEHFEVLFARQAIWTARQLGIIRGVSLPTAPPRPIIVGMPAAGNQGNASRRSGGLRAVDVADDSESLTSFLQNLQATARAPPAQPARPLGTRPSAAPATRNPLPPVTANGRKLRPPLPKRAPPRKAPARRRRADSESTIGGSTADDTSSDDSGDTESTADTDSSSSSGDELMISFLMNRKRPTATKPAQRVGGGKPTVIATAKKPHARAAPTTRCPWCADVDPASRPDPNERCMPCRGPDCDDRVHRSCAAKDSMRCPTCAPPPMTIGAALFRWVRYRPSLRIEVALGDPMLSSP